MFAKNKPTKKLEFNGGWVELQFLSKGVKDEIASRLSSLFSGFDSETLKKIDKARKQKQENTQNEQQNETTVKEDNDDIPTEVAGMVGKIQAVEYYKLTQAIKAWSEDEAVTEDSIKELDDVVFDEISKEVDKMNELSKDEIKN